MSGARRESRSMSEACCEETTTVSRRTALSPSYSMVTWVLPSGRRYGIVPFLRTWERHQRRRLVRRVAEHQALVARTLLVELVLVTLDTLLVRRVDALRDVGRLRADGHRNATGRAVEALLRGVVADLEDLVAHQLRDRRVRLGGDLSGHVHQAGGDQRLHGDPGMRVLAKKRVENGVTDLVSDLVGVTLGHRLRGEQATGHNAP
jgi:hypothetical protein